MEIKESKWRNVNIGFCTKKGFGTYGNHCMTESAYYGCFGWINKDGHATNINLDSKESELLLVEVDLNKS